MPSAAVTRIRQRIGTMGLPGIVWPVFEQDGETTKTVAFYDRERAQAYAAASPARILATVPLQIRDA